MSLYLESKVEMQKVEEVLALDNKCYVKFLNHGSAILSSKKIKILCDPWFNGGAFNGWSLLDNDSHDITNLYFDYIWISHEHPDHFSIPTLAKLKTSQTFLYQETEDKKVKTYLENKGHKVIELPDKNQIKLNDLLITSVSCDGYDSCLIIKFPNDKIVININDARVDLDDFLKNELKPLLGGNAVDLLMFQYSYVNWAGNKGDELIPSHQQQLVDKKNEYAIEVLKPKRILPFASFIYFSHEENFYCNEKNWLDHVIDLFSKKSSQLILPSPDQIISLEDNNLYDLKKTNKIARDFWMDKSKNLKIISKSKLFSLENLKEAYENFLINLHKRNTLLPKVETSDNFVIFVKIKDLDLIVSIGLLKKHFIVEKNSSNFCVNLSSETFSFLMNNSFGRGTITINGRAEFNYDYAHQFFLFFFIYYANNIGKYFDEFSKIPFELLNSVSRTSVMSSILFFNEKAKKNLDKDAKFLSQLLSKVVHNKSDLDKFNEEPPNDRLR